MLITKRLPNQLDYMTHENKYVFNKEFGYIPPKKEKSPLTQKRTTFTAFGATGSGLGIWDSWNNNNMVFAGSGTITPVIEMPVTLATKIESCFIFNRNMQEGLSIQFSMDRQK